MGTALQIFLIINVFIIGAATALAIQHAYEHYRPPKPEPKKPVHPDTPIPRAVREQLLADATAKYQRALESAGTELEQELKITAKHLDEQLIKLGRDVINEEMTRYKTTLEDLREQTKITIGTAQIHVAEHQTELESKFTARQAELEAKLQQDIAAKKEQLEAELNTKLADAVTSFLIETMGHNIDLGAQVPYLLATLEEHKAEIIQGAKG
jgi:hypothetical protein